MTLQRPSRDTKEPPNGDHLQPRAHRDPLDPGCAAPDPDAWPPRQLDAWNSPEMEAFRSALRIGGGDERAGVISDLASYFEIAPDEAVRRALHWAEWYVSEWTADERDSAASIRDFYRTTQATAFDVLWYAYLQSAGQSYPVSVAIARTLKPHSAGRHHLDFGSGVGVTAQLFQRLGYDTTLADVSNSLLAFARYRLDRRETPAKYLDLNDAALGVNAYDVITAIDVLVHVPDLKTTIAVLHRALRPGGILFANFDVRPQTEENVSHLYADDLPLRWQLQRAGFEPEESLDGMITRYRRVDPAGVSHALRGARDLALLRSPARPAFRAAKAYLRGIARQALARR